MLPTAHKADLNWSEQLSFEKLKEEGLVSNYNQWNFLMNSIKPENARDEDKIIVWLNHQAEPFRISHLTHKLISGYIRCISSLNKHVIQEIQNIIISYCNLLFVKLFYGINDKQYELRTFDTNLSNQVLAKLMEIEHNLNIDRQKYLLPDVVRIWMRFGLIKAIYPITTDNINVTEEKVNSSDIDSLKWMEIPSDYIYHSLYQVDEDLNYDEILEIGVEFYDEIRQEWKWSAVESNNKDQTLTKEEWIKTLKSGDIINAKDDRGKWYESLVRFAEDNKVYIHFIGWNTKFDTMYDCNLRDDLICLDKRYSHVMRSHIPKKSRQKKMNDIYLSWRIE